MKIYAVTIKPDSAFGTSLKGDTIFGHFCWQAVLDATILQNGFDHWLDLYPENPFAVFSSAWPKLVNSEKKEFYCLPKPAMPSAPAEGMTRQDRVKQRKKAKKQKWLVVEHDSLQDDLAGCPSINDRELFERHLDSLPLEQKRSLQFLPVSHRKPIITATQAHNSIDRLTMTTGRGFDPFSMDNFYYLPGLELVIFVGVNEDALSKEQLQKGLAQIGQCGFGRDASTGLGRFSISGEIKELSWPGLAADQGCYTLAPCVPMKENFQEQFSLPFTRFGRHGGHLVLSGKPFKNPVVMADEGAVFMPKTDCMPLLPFIGQAVTDLSLAEKRTVAQGYSLYLPMIGRN